MTAMLADLVSTVADEIRVVAGLRSPANDDGDDLLERLLAAGQLDIPDLIAVLLCRAEQEQLAARIGIGGRRRPSGLLDALAASEIPELASSAMAVILARSRRRDRFNAPRLLLDDVPPDAAVRLVDSIASAIAAAEGGGEQEAQRLDVAGAEVLDRHDDDGSIDSSWTSLVSALEEAGRFDDDILRLALADGELGIFAAALARRAGLDWLTAWSQLAAGGNDLARLLRMAAVPAPLGAEFAAVLGEARAVAPGEALRLRTGADRLPDSACEDSGSSAGAAPVGGRVDGEGRLVAADRLLEELQREAGSSLGLPLALPQLAAIVRTARELQSPVARRAMAAGATQDIDMWVRAVPEGEEVRLTIERWVSRPPAGPAPTGVADSDEPLFSDRAGGGAADAARTDPMFDELLRSPLRQIIATADRIAGRSDGPLGDDYASYAADISAAAHHLLSVVRSMGEQSGAGRSAIDLGDLVYEAVALIETAAIEREIAIAVEPVHGFTAFGQAGAVIQILVNLIGNAVRHSPVRATVTISFERSAEQAIVHVADDGPGIDPADQQRIFERFERGSGDGPGSGLGLAIARRLARSMDGDVILESRPEMGARFSLLLPAA